MGRHKDPDKSPDNLLLEFFIIVITFAFQTSQWMEKRYRRLNRKQRRQIGDYSKKAKTVQSPYYALLQNMKEFMRKEVINIILITMAIINVYFVISENWMLNVLKILLNASFDYLDNNISWIFCNLITFIASTTFIKVLKATNIIQIHSSTLNYVKIATVCHLFFQNYGISIILLLLIVAVNKITVLYEGKHCFSILYSFESGASFQRLYNEVPYSMKRYFREKCNGSVHLKKEHGMNMALRFIDNPISSSKNDMNEPFDIFVKSEGGKVFTITVTERLTVDEMKQKIEEKEGIKLCNQRLYFGGKPLFNNKHISHYNIKPDSFIHLHVAVRGGSKQNQNDKCYQRYNASNSSSPNTLSLDFQSQQYIDHTRICQNCSRSNFEICYTAQNMVSKLSDDQISKIGIQGKVPLVATMGLINEKSRRERIKKHSTPSKTTVEGAATKSDEPSTSNPSSTVPGNISAWEELEYHTSHCFNCEYFYNGGCCMADSIASKLTDTEIKEKRNAGPMRLKLQFILGRVSRQRRQYKSISATSNDNTQREKKDDILLSNDAKINKPALLKSRIGMSNKLPPEFFKSSSGLPSSNKLPPAFTAPQQQRFQPSEPLNDTDAAISSSSEEESDTSESSNDSSETSDNSDTSEETTTEESSSESESDTSEETTSEETSSECESSDNDDVEEDSSNSSRNAAKKFQKSIDSTSPKCENSDTHKHDPQICDKFTQTDPVKIEYDSTKLNFEQEKKEDPVMIDLIHRLELLDMKVNALSHQQQNSTNDNKLCQDMSLLKMNENGHKEPYNSESDSSSDIPFSIFQINRGKKEPTNKKAKNEPKAKNIPREAHEIQLKIASYEKLNARTVRGSCPMCGTSIQPGPDTENHLNICKIITLPKLQDKYDKIMASENSSSDDTKSSKIKNDNSSESDDFIPANINRERKQPKSKTKKSISDTSKSKIDKKCDRVPLINNSEEKEKQNDPQPSNNGTFLPQIQINNTQSTAVNNSILLNNLQPEINQSNSTQQENKHQPEENPQEPTPLEKALEHHQISYASDYLDDNAYLSTDHLYLLMTLLWSLYPETDVAYYSPAMLGDHNVATLETIENLSNGSWRNDNTNMMLFPVNENYNHWALYAYDRRNHQITYYNPLGGEPIADDYYWILENIFNLFNAMNPQLITAQLPPHLQQNDKTNCGIYVFDYIHTLLNGNNIHDIPRTYDIGARRARLRNLLNSTYQNDIIKPQDITDFNSTPSNIDRKPGLMTHLENVMEREREKQLLNPNTSNTSQFPAQLPNIKIEPKSDNSDDNDTNDSNDSDVEILDEVPYKFIQLPSQVTTSNTTDKPLTEAQFDEKLNECVKENESHSFCYLLTFKNATNDADQMLDEAFYYGFSTRIVLTDRLKEHITNATKNKKGPLANFTPEQIDNVIIIPINRGKVTANRILEAVLIRLEAELPPILNNIANELISSDEIESLISINSTQRENVITILHEKLKRAIENYVRFNPIQMTNTQNANNQSHRLKQFLEILMDKTKSNRLRLLEALEYEHPYSENDAPHHCYGVFHTDEDIDKMLKHLIYFGQTSQQLLIRIKDHYRKPRSAIYSDLKSKTNNLLFIQLLWGKTNAKKCKDLEAIQIWLGLKNMLPIKLKLKNKLPLMPIVSPLFKKILLNKDGKYTVQLEVIENGILDNIKESIKRHNTALKTKTNLEFIFFHCNYKLQNGNLCNSAYAKSGDLTIHKRSHTGERPYICNYKLQNGTTCNKTFTSSSHLSQHQISHNAERPYICNYKLQNGTTCTAAFKYTFDLTKHNRTHTGERPYKCTYKLQNGNLCNSAYATSGDLTIHKRSHTGERPYICNYKLQNGTTCNITFTSSSHLSKHMKRKHKIIEHK